MKLSTVKKRLKGYLRTEILAPNHTVTVFENGNVLQSYDSIISIKVDHKTYLGPNWDFSRTTGKYRNLHLGTNKQEVLERIKLQTYKVLE